MLCVLIHQSAEEHKDNIQDTQYWMNWVPADSHSISAMSEIQYFCQSHACQGDWIPRRTQQKHVKADSHMPYTKVQRRDAVISGPVAPQNNIAPPPANPNLFQVPRREVSLAIECEMMANSSMSWSDLDLENPITKQGPDINNPDLFRIRDPLVQEMGGDPVGDMHPHLLWIYAVVTWLHLQFYLPHVACHVLLWMFVFLLAGIAPALECPFVTLKSANHALGLDVPYQILTLCTLLQVPGVEDTLDDWRKIPCSPGIYQDVFNVNLAPEFRYRTTNLLLLSILPGPHEQPPNEIQRYLRPIINDLRRLWKEGIKVPTPSCPEALGRIPIRISAPSAGSSRSTRPPRPPLNMVVILHDYFHLAWMLNNGDWVRSMWRNPQKLHVNVLSRTKQHGDRRQAPLGPDTPLFGTRIPPGTSTQSPNSLISPSTLFDIFDGARRLLEARHGRPDASRVDPGTSSAFGEQ
ncbi:predicted protein [Postia placenta Mad-698-R]|nr:predicted protein [Postia placenta Mad-698-R]